MPTTTITQEAAMTVTTEIQTLKCFGCDGEGVVMAPGAISTTRSCDICDGRGFREIEEDVCPEPMCDGETHYTGQRDRFTNEDIEAGPCLHGGFVPPF